MTCWLCCFDSTAIGRCSVCSGFIESSLSLEKAAEAEISITHASPSKEPGANCFPKHPFIFPFFSQLIFDVMTRSAQVPKCFFQGCKREIGAPPDESCFKGGYNLSISHFSVTVSPPSFVQSVMNTNQKEIPTFRR